MFCQEDLIPGERVVNFLVTPNNGDIVKKFIFRFLSVPFMNDKRNIFVRITIKNNFNKLSS